MSAANYTAAASAELAELLDRVRAGVAAEVAELHLPKLAEVVLGGGYGRGEGGVWHTPQGDRLYNDLDFFVFSDHASKPERRAIEAALGPISERWEKKLGIAVDFSPVKNLSALRGVLLVAPGVYAQKQVIPDAGRGVGDLFRAQHGDLLRLIRERRGGQRDHQAQKAG